MGAVIMKVPLYRPSQRVGIARAEDREIVVAQERHIREDDVQGREEEFDRLILSL